MGMPLIDTNRELIERVRIASRSWPVLIPAHPRTASSKRLQRMNSKLSPRSHTFVDALPLAHATSRSVSQDPGFGCIWALRWS
jgi:hypothetical protein